MRTNAYDVTFNGFRLTVVRLKDGAPVVDAAIPADALAAVSETLKAALEGQPAPQPEPQPAPTKKRTTKKKTE